MYISVHSVKAEKANEKGAGRTHWAESHRMKASIEGGNLQLTVESESDVFFESQQRFYKTGTVRLSAMELSSIVQYAIDNDLLSVSLVPTEPEQD